MPNERWHADFTHYRLADGTDTEILAWLDDCTRYALTVTGHDRVTGPIARDTFAAACATHGVPASTRCKGVQNVTYVEVKFSEIYPWWTRVSLISQAAKAVLILQINE